MAPLISLIVPVYNTAPYLEECVQSVLKQTYSDFELILVNDGSDDGSGQLCERLSREDQRIRVLHREHKGVSAARNAGMSLAQTCSAGKYLFFLDSDDSIHPELLQELCALAEETKAAVVSSDFVMIGEDETVPAGGDGEKGYIYLDNSTALRSLCVPGKLMTLLSTVGGKLLCKEAIGTLMFDETMESGEDSKFLYQLFDEGAEAVISHRQWYYYRQRKLGVTHRKTPKLYYDAFRCHKYISGSEFAKGRRANAAKREQCTVIYLIDEYNFKHFEHDKQTEAFLKGLIYNELKSPEFSLLPLSYKIRLRLVFHGYPFYLILRWVYSCFKNQKEGV